VKKIVLGGWLFCLLWAICIGSAYLYGIRYNPTNSIPSGFWRVSKTAKTFHYGQVISICPTNTTVFRLGHTRGYLGSGMCKGGYQPLLKPIAALPGDKVTVTRSAIWVNGKVLQNSSMLPNDSNGRPMPQIRLGRHIVPAGSVWLISSYNPKSFDSRYYGPLPIRNIEGVAKPIWVRSEAP